MSAGLAERTIWLHGMGITNLAAARALLRHGHPVLVSDDGDPERLAAFADELAEHAEHPEMVQLVAPAGHDALDGLLGRVDAVLPTPGLPDLHPVLELAERLDVPVLSEFDLAAAWDDRPMLAVTGTNGKTTVTTLVDEMLNASGRPSAAVGNTEVPLVAAIEDPSTEVFVVEASSFRLARSRRFRPRVGTWLNFAEDHLDVHRTVEGYRAAKARIWAEQGPGDVAVANADDPVVLAAAPRRDDGPELVTFGLGGAGRAPAGFHELDGVLRSDDGEELARSDQLWSTLPHDRSNVLAAAATALRGGADLHGVRRAIAGFRGLAHRVQLVGERDGVRWFDDSKATAPHATLAALDGFESVVLIAGGRNKGLDLSVLGTASPRVRGVVGIGEAGDEVVAAFAGRPGAVADSMEHAVRLAAGMAAPGDVVLLSPGCASFDWYRSYGERGDDFVAAVRSSILGEGAA